MANLLAILTATVALVAGVQAQCAPNARTCGRDLVNSGCTTAATLRSLVPQPTDPQNCVIQTNAQGKPIDAGFCCSAGASVCVNGDCVVI